MKSFFRSLQFLLDLILPPRAEDLLAREVNYETLAKLLSPREIEGDCIALFDYRHSLIAALIRTLKYHGNKDAASLLGRALADWMLEEMSDRELFEKFEKPIIIPIPLSPKRLSARGFNQTELIAQECLNHVSVKDFTVVADALVRVKDTESQTKQLGRVAREKNLEGAFFVKDDSSVRERSIILLDDVVTTGATMRAAKAALLQARAAQVLCVAVAH